MASAATIPSSRDGFREAIEEIRGIVRTSCRLWVVLHTEGRSVHELESLDDVVVQAHVGGPAQVRRGCRFPPPAALAQRTRGCER